MLAFDERLAHLSTRIEKCARHDFPIVVYDTLVFLYSAFESIIAERYRPENVKIHGFISINERV